jgi:hypothetical protein
MRVTKANEGGSVFPSNSILNLGIKMEVAVSFALRPLYLPGKNPQVPTEYNDESTPEMERTTWKRGNFFPFPVIETKLIFSLVCSLVTNLTKIFCLHVAVQIDTYVPTFRGTYCLLLQEISVKMEIF